MKKQLILVLMLSIFIVYTLGGTDKKLSAKKDLVFGLMNSALSLSLQDNMSAEELLNKLHIVQRAWDKKPLSEEEMNDALITKGYIYGVFYGFLQGVSADNFSAVYKSTHKLPKRPLLSDRENVDFGQIVNLAVKRLERIPQETRKVSMAANLLGMIFLESDLYIENKQ